MKKNSWVLIGGALLVGFGLTSFLLLDGSRSLRSSLIVPFSATFSGPIYSSGLSSQAFFDTAYDKALMSPSDAPDAVRSIVSPHHLLVADRVAGLFASTASPRIETVILLSPNHFSKGRAPILLSQGAWDTPYGRVFSDVEGVQEVVASFPASSSRVISIDETPFPDEHGVASLTPFIARSFPNAQIVPILFDETALGHEEVSILMQTLAQQYPEAFLVASVDFSHYLPTAPQAFHDDVSIACLKRGTSCQPLDGSIDLEVDSNVTLGALKVWNATLGAEVFTEAFHTSSLGVIPSGLAEENTSHVGGWFSDGDPSPEPFLSFQIVGDMMLDRGTRVKTNEFGVAYPWEKVGRFLRGTHLVVGNLEGTVNERPSLYTYDPPFQFVFEPFMIIEMQKHVDLVSLANNHVRDVGLAGEKETRERLDALGVEWFGSWSDPSFVSKYVIGDVHIAFIGYHAFAPDEPALVEAIKRLRGQGDFVVVLPHWGNEYQFTHSVEQRRLAQVMIDAGADLIVGGHPHVVQDREVIDGVPVVYSLGNFVFDQRIPETWTGLSLGVTIDAQSVTLYPLPIGTKGSQPTPFSDAFAQKFYSGLTPSPYDFSSRGVLRVPRRK